MLQSSEVIRVTLPEQAETLDVFGASLEVLSDSGNLPLLLGRHVVPPGYAVPPHVHEHDDEVFVILEGELTVAGPHGEARVGPGSSVELPRGIPHSFRNDTAAPVQLLVMALPGQHSVEMFRHFDRAGKGPSQLTPGDIPVIAEQYGVRFV